MKETNHPELHVYEEPRNDFLDVAVGFAGMFGFMFVVAIIATILTMVI